LAAALRINHYAEESGYNKPTSILSRVLAKAPYFPRCSDDKTAKWVRPREYAVRQPYMQVNPQAMTSWLIFDMDERCANPLIWEERGIPEPNIVVRNKYDLKCHLFYAIKPVCTSDKARQGPQKYLKAVYNALRDKLGADIAYSGPVAKTPGHPDWQTWPIHNQEYELGELAEGLELTWRKTWEKDSSAVYTDAESRHCLLFDTIRQYAYSIVTKYREERSYDSFYRRIEEYAESHNNFVKRGFSSDLTFSQVKATVKSVSRWTWEHYTGSGRQSGQMNLRQRKDLSVSEKQRLSSLRTNSLRKERTEDKIRRAIKVLESSGKKLTLTAVSQTARITRQTVAKYRYIFSRLQSVKIIPMKNILVKSVNYATHQIPALARCEIVSFPILKKGIETKPINTS